MLLIQMPINLKLKVGRAFDIDELIEKVQDEIVTYYANKQEDWT